MDSALETPNYHQPVIIVVDEVKIGKLDIESVILRYWINNNLWVILPMSLDFKLKEDNYSYANSFAEICTMPHNNHVT